MHASSPGLATHIRVIARTPPGLCFFLHHVDYSVDTVNGVAGQPVVTRNALGALPFMLCLVYAWKMLEAELGISHS